MNKLSRKIQSKIARSKGKEFLKDDKSGKNSCGKKARQLEGGFAPNARKKISKNSKDSFARDNFFDGKNHKKKSGKPASVLPRQKDAYLVQFKPMFAPQKIAKESQKILEDFDEVVQGVRPLSPKQFHLLPGMISRLSHSLTDERAERRVGYMNEAALLSAYTRYFSWWNLVRLTRLFANIDTSEFDLREGDVCLDIGSGPLTVVTALWLAQPDLRKAKLTWYCLDISKSALALGEDIFLSVVAKTSPQFAENWKIIRVAGSLGTPIKQKAAFITCANMFNEIYQDTNEAPEFYAKKFSEAISSYAAHVPNRQAKFFVIEPGIPKTARFVSLMRDAFLRKDMSVASPCPHESACPMNGVSAHRGGESKWCNFSFNTLKGDGSQKIYAEDIPAKLQKLSESAKLGKYRAVISFVFAKTNLPDKKNPCGNEGDASRETNCGEEVALRVASEPIKLPNGETGFYACSKLGLVLAVNGSRRDFCSGDLLKICMKHGMDFSVDEKSGAQIIRLGD